MNIFKAIKMDANLCSVEEELNEVEVKRILDRKECSFSLKRNKPNSIWIIPYLLQKYLFLCSFA